MSSSTRNGIELTVGELRKDVGGLRTQGNFKSSLLDKPLITVVTVVFNGEQFLEETIKSVINQTYSNIEYIIIDGGSTDGTIDIIRKYEHAIDYWVSEKDAGIYDAMNKGIGIASGDWINFMNGGDIFFLPDTIMKIFNRTVDNETIIYGNVHIRYKDFTRIEMAQNPQKLWSGMKFCHQSVFCSLQYHKRKLFNINNKVCADLEFFYSAYKNNAKYQYVDMVISSVQVGGLSESNRLQTLCGSRSAVLNSGASSIVGLYYAYKYLDVSFRTYLKKLLPASVIKKIIQLK